MAIVYAFCCLLFAAVNDFVFKLFANHSQASADRKSCGGFVTLVGLVEVILLSPLIHDVADWKASLLWGLLGGFLSVASNILLIESMRFQSAGVSSTIFRLNMVLVVLGSFLFLGESMTWLVVTGVVCAALAVIAFIPGRSGSNGGSSPSRAGLGFCLALAACLLRALMSLSYKGAFTHGADVNVVTVVTGAWWVVGGPIFACVREHHVSLPDRSEWIIGLTSGVLVCGIVFFMARMNACGNASIVNPIAQMSFLGTFLLSAVFLKERFTARKVVAILLGCVAILCLTL